MTAAKRAALLRDRLIDVLGNQPIDEADAVERGKWLASVNQMMRSLSSHDARLVWLVAAALYLGQGEKEN